MTIIQRSLLFNQGEVFAGLSVIIVPSKLIPLLKGVLIAQGIAFFHDFVFPGRLLNDSKRKYLFSGSTNRSVD